MYLRRIPNAKGFSPNSVVSDPNPVGERTGQFSPDGVFSERIFGKMPNIGREYSCMCSATTGRFLEGSVCPQCHTPVTCKDLDHTKAGFIDLKGHMVISLPAYYYIDAVIGRTNLTKILTYRQDLDINGIAYAPEGTAVPYEGLGLLGFIEKWEEILDLYAARKSSDSTIQAYVDALKSEPDIIFTDKIYVYNPILRPSLVVNKVVIFDAANNFFNLMISAANTLNDLTDHEYTLSVVNGLLLSIQQQFVAMGENSITTLSGKLGRLRQDLLGIRVNFSARAVITPLSNAGYAHDEILIPYHTFLTLYKYKLIKLISLTRNISIKKAAAVWEGAQQRRDKSVVRLMMQLISNSSVDGRGVGLPALINRNPTISFGSILQVRIIGISDGYTIRLHNGILQLMAADYDGDVVTVIPLFGDDLVRATAVFNPCRMFVSRDGKGFNSSLLLAKDHALGISILTDDEKFG